MSIKNHKSLVIKKVNRVDLIRRVAFIILLLVLASAFITMAHAQSVTKTSNTSGDWSNAGTWTPNGVPSSTDNVLIASNHEVAINGNFQCNNLTIGNGAAAQLRFSNGFFSFGAARNFTVNGNLVINSAATFDVYSGINTHQLYIKRDLTNNGTIDFRGNSSWFPLSSSRADINFIGNNNQKYDGNATQNRLNLINLNMGNSSGNVLDVTVSLFDVPSNFLSLANGTFKYATNISHAITPFTIATSISATSGLWLSSSNSTVSCDNNLSFAGPITIDSGTLALTNNFTNNGNFTQNNGWVVLKGSNAQSLAGTNPFNFLNLQLDNNTGAIQNNTINLITELKLSNGTFNTNSKPFTLISTSAGTGRISQITGSGNITGNIIVQRFAPGGKTGWALIGTPIVSGLTLNDWDDDIYISCPSCPDGSASNFKSIYTYDETAAGDYSSTASYIPLSTINDPIVPNKGYWVYLGDGQTTTNNLTLDVTGPVRKFNQSIPLSFTNNDSPANIGWNLIHNPYPSPISWSALRNGNAAVDNAIYTYNADIGTTVSYVNGISSPAVGAGGIGDNIPMSQGFYVHVSSATSLNATESIKVSGNPTFLKSNNQTPALLRLRLSGNGYQDETVIYTQNGASTSFDVEYDALKMSAQNASKPVIVTINNENEFQINGISPVNGTYTTEVKVVSGSSGIYKISALDFDAFPKGACFNLYDKFTNTNTNIKASSYFFNFSDTTSVPRFVLSITINELQVNAITEQPTCSNFTAGNIIVNPTGNGPWNYYWKDQNNNLIRTQLLKNGPDTLAGLISGNYLLEMHTLNGCNNFELNKTIIKQIPAIANFEVNDPNNNPINSEIVFYNKSYNTSSYDWDFGDGLGTSSNHSPTYSYSALGEFQVRLISSSSTGCRDTVTKTITINDKPIGVAEYLSLENNLLVKTLPNNQYEITQTLNNELNVSYEIIDINGKVIASKSLGVTNAIVINLDLESHSKGVYLLKINYDNTFFQPIKLIAN
ncbi:MAG: PKD domain-containing protein [Bacteroidia bacterium]